MQTMIANLLFDMGLLWVCLTAFAASATFSIGFAIVANSFFRPVSVSHMANVDNVVATYTYATYQIHNKMFQLYQSY